MSNLRRRLMTQNEIPLDYQRVEYIENLSTAYIETNFKPSNKTVVDFEFDIQELNYQGGSQLGDSGLFVANGARNFAVYFKSTWKLRSNFGFKYSTTDNSITSGIRYKIHMAGGLLYVNGELWSSIPDSEFQASSTFMLMASNLTGSADYFMSGRLYSCRIWDESTLVRDFVPVLHLPTFTYGLWDKVERKFYTSPNGVKFTGPMIFNGEEYELAEYIENTSNAYINSGVTGKISRMEGTWEFRKFGGHDQWLHGLFILDNSFGMYLHSDTSANTLTVGTHYNGNKGITNLSPSFIGKKLDIHSDYTSGNTYLSTSNESFRISDAVSPVLSGSLGILCRMTRDGYSAESDSFACARIYSLKIWKEGNLVRDYIPVLQKSSGLYGLFDRISRGFYTSPNGTKFIGKVSYTINNVKYTRVEYLENKSNAYIDTGCVGSGYTGIVSKFNYASGSDSSVMIGTNIAEGIGWALLHNKSGSDFNRFSFSYLSSPVESNVPSDESVHKFSLKRGVAAIDNIEQFRLPAQAFTQLWNFHIFGTYWEHLFTQGSVYYAKFDINDKKVRDFVPVLNLSTGKYGLLDLVERKFYTSPNGTDFYGPVPDGYTVITDTDGKRYVVDVVGEFNASSISNL